MVRLAHLSLSLLALAAYASISANSGATVKGRLISSTEGVSMSGVTVNVGSCPAVGHCQHLAATLPLALTSFLASLSVCLCAQIPAPPKPPGPTPSGAVSSMSSSAGLVSAVAAVLFATASMLV